MPLLLLQTAYCCAVFESETGYLPSRYQLQGTCFGIVHNIQNIHSKRKTGVTASKETVFNNILLSLILGPKSKFKSIHIWSLFYSILCLLDIIMCSAIVPIIQGEYAA